MIPDLTIMHRVGLAVCAVGGISDTLDRAHVCHSLLASTHYALEPI